MNLPEQHDTGLRTSLRGAGSIAMIDAIRHAIRFQSPDADLSDLFGISGAPFATYAFEPRFNEHLDPVPLFSHHAELFSNYGPIEAIAYATGWDVKEVNQISDDDFWKLARFELAQNRPVVCVDSDFSPRLIVAYEADMILIDSSDTRHTIGPDTFKSEDGALENWIVFARPGERAEWSAPITRLRTNVLRWSSEHLNGSKEFFQDSRENYTVGIDALETTLRLETENANNPEWREFAARHLTRMVHARRDAQAALETWAQPLADHTDATAEQILAVASHFERSHHALTSDDSFANAYKRAIEHERNAATALAQLVSVFPSVFG